MTVFPFQINEAIYLYNRVSKLKPSAMLERDQGGPRDVVDISAEGKKRQILEQARGGVPERIHTVK